MLDVYGDIIEVWDEGAVSGVPGFPPAFAFPSPSINLPLQSWPRLGQFRSAEPSPSAAAVLVVVVVISASHCSPTPPGLLGNPLIPIFLVPARPLSFPSGCSGGDDADRPFELGFGVE